MTDIVANARRARELGFDLTADFTHQQVEQLAGLWVPEIRFHEEERFHPIDLERLFKVPVDVFDSLQPPAQERLLIKVSGPAGDRLFKPPVVRNGADVLLHGGEINKDLDTTPDGTEKLLEGVGSNTIYSHGKSRDRSIEFFGASDTVLGNPEPLPGDPRVPAHTIVLRAEMRFLRESLRHYLQKDTPVDSLWGWFSVEDLIIRSPEPVLPSARVLKREILFDLLNAWEAKNLAAQAAALQRIPPAQQGWSFAQRAWDAVRFYAFLEFYFVYAYNDYPDYGDWPFINEHEGDVEGCCVVFDRRDLDAVVARTKTIEEVIAHTVITSVHEPFNDNDELKRLPVERDRARDDLVVWVAPGSHATYLSAGTHDVLDWEDILTDWPGQVGGWQEIVLGILYPVIFPLLLIAAITEHFVDAEDETTDNGVRTGPEGTTPVGGTNFAHELLVTPLSRIGDPAVGDPGDLNLYQAGFDPPEHGLDSAELARRAYFGKWGAHEDVADHSSQWEVKTARYFRKFVESGEITGDIIL